MNTSVGADSAVDEIELAKFRRMSDEWWDPNGSCRPLHELNPARLQFIDDRCHLTHKKVLDIGCGGGILSESMAKRGAEVTGIDAEESLIKIAAQHANQTSESKKLNYFHSTAENYAESHKETFDVITCLELLEHVPNPSSVIKAAAEMVKPNGYVFFSTLNRNPKSFLFAIVAAEHILKLLPTGTHQYKKFIRPAELECELRESGLTLIELAGLSYNPLLKSAKITNDVSVNYLACAQKIVENSEDENK